MRLRLLFFSTILRFGEVFCGDWQDHWELPVLYQDCEKTEPCCWKTYEGFIKQYNSLIITWLYDKSTAQATDVDFCIAQCDAHEGCNAFWHYQDSRVFLLHFSQWWWGRRFCYLSRAPCRPQSAWPYKPMTNEAGEVHDLTLSLYVRKREDTDAILQAEFNVHKQTYEHYPERICTDIFDTISQSSLDWYMNIFNDFTIDMNINFRTLISSEAQDYWSTHGLYKQLSLEECIEACTKVENCRGVQFVGSVHKELEDDEVGICYTYDYWSCPPAEMDPFHLAHFYEKKKSSVLVAPTHMQVSYDADFGPPMLQHLCRRKSLLMPSLTNEGHCMDACNHNETCLGVFLHKGRSILDKIDCYFNYDVCSIKDQTNFLKTDSPNDKLLWRRPVGMANFTLYEGKICIVFTGKSDVQKVWERLVKMTAFGIFSPLLENKNAWAEMDYNRLAIHNGITLLECTKACGNNTLCQSFYFNQYNSMTGRTYCELFQKVCNPYFLISSPGLNYYVKQPPTIYTHDVTKKNQLFKQKYIFDRMGCDSATGKVSGRLQHHMWDEGGNLIPEADVFHFTKNNFVVNYVVDTLGIGTNDFGNTNDHLKTIAVKWNEECAAACESDRQCKSFYVFRTQEERQKESEYRTCRLVSSVCNMTHLKHTGFEYYADDSFGLLGQDHFPYRTRKPQVPKQSTSSTRPWLPRRPFLRRYTTRRPFWHPDRIDRFQRLLRAKPSPTPLRPMHPPPTVGESGGTRRIVSVVVYLFLLALSQLSQF